MAERYPDDATLLALAEDSDTGVQYIPTGQSPYYLEFRRLIQRLLLAGQRANDLRVYQDGDLSIGVRAGRCMVGGTVRVFDGSTGIAIAANSSTHVWLDQAGALQTGLAGLPADRSTFIALAEVVTGSSSITALTDLRGEAFLASPSAAVLGLTATVSEINQALDGIDANVTAAKFVTLCGGPTSNANTLHMHTQQPQVVAGDAIFKLINSSSDAAANMALALSLPQHLPDDTWLLVNRDNGFLQQRYYGATYNLVGVVDQQWGHEGALTATVTGKLLGVVPVSGTVTAVILSAKTNLQSSDSADGISATAKVNGFALTSTDPQLTSVAGSGFKSTAQGDGTSAVIKTDGTEQVTRGDVLTVDITRLANGTVNVEAADVVVMVVIRVDQPE
jgi:hypothetical protein